MDLPSEVYRNLHSPDGLLLPWSCKTVHDQISADPRSAKVTIRTTERALDSSGLIPASLTMDEIVDELGQSLKRNVKENLEQEAARKRYVSLILQEHRNDSDLKVLFVNDKRSGRRWVYLNEKDQEKDQEKGQEDSQVLIDALLALAGDRNVVLWPSGTVTARLRELQTILDQPFIKTASGKTIKFGLAAYHDPTSTIDWEGLPDTGTNTGQLSHLDRLEADSIFILREVVSQARNPALLFSLGKDSCVMLHLARKAFYPSPPPFPLLHVDTRWKFNAMYRFRDEIARTSGLDMIIHVNPESEEKNINPFDHGSELHTHVTKTEGLIQALEKYQIDVAIGGARRDEEKSRAKERVFSIRSSTHHWDSKRQRPELWNLYNGYKDKDESIRAFPLSDWTELDIWQYIYREQIPIVPLYFAAYRPVVERDGILMLVDDDRARLYPGEEIEIKKVRFRTLGCYPLTGAVESTAEDVPSIVLELLQSSKSERQGRVIDQDADASMEKKKQEGYF